MERRGLGLAGARRAGPEPESSSDRGAASGLDPAPGSDDNDPDPGPPARLVKAFLDACVLYPTVLREILVGVARAGLYAPLWSPRVLEEWARAARKVPGGEAVARGEVAALRADWPRAEVRPGEATMARLWLPDPNDVHVLAAASDGGADLLVTLNLRDFPRGDVAGEGLRLASPDAFLMELWLAEGDAVAAVVERVRGVAEALSGEAQPVRKLLGRARLPRLGKALG